MIARVLGLILLTVSGVGDRTLDITPDETAKSWSLPNTADVRVQLADALEETSLAVVERDRILAQFDDQVHDEGTQVLLPAILSAAAQIEPKTKELAELLERVERPIPLRDFAFLRDATLPPFFRRQLQLAYGEWLIRQRLYDEAAQQLEGLTPAQVVEPAALLFCQGVERFNKLEQEPALLVLGQLLEREGNIPRRFAALAKLMQAELAPLEEDSLDHIARRMGDVERRLDLGRPGKPTQEVEEGVVKSLDKMIDKLEQQRQQQKRQMSRQSQAPFDPKKGDRPGEVSGPGDVTSKDVGGTGGWGDLPPKQREEAIQQIGKEFPAHYRDVIEQFFRKLATGEEEHRP